MNRQQRRAGQSVHRKEVRRALNAGEWGPWEDMTSDFRHTRLYANKTSDHVIFFKKNAIYSVQAFQQHNYILVGIRRHDQSADIPWRDKQRIKSELFGDEMGAIEFFPPERWKVDQANMFWLWVIHPDRLGQFAEIDLRDAHL